MEEIDRNKNLVDPNNEANTDYQVVRHNLQDIILVAQQATTEVAIIADQSQSPRFYEVLSALLSTSISANKELMDLHKKKKEIRGLEQPQQKTTINNKTLIIASTNEILDQLNKQLATKEIEHDDN